MRRLDQRQGFLVSAAIHLTLLMILIAHPPSPRTPERIDPSTLERKDLVFLPAPSVLRQIIPAPARTAVPVPRPNTTPMPMPVPMPTPATEEKKDRVSVGGPGPQAKGPLRLKREDDLTRMAARGEPMATPTPTPPPVAAPLRPGKAGPGLTPKVEGREQRAGREGLSLPPHLYGTGGASGDEGQRPRVGRDAVTEEPGVPLPQPPGTSLDRAAAAAIDEVTRRMKRDAQLGIPTGRGLNLGGFAFDPQGADFTLWLNSFKNELYRNWIAPQSVVFGFGRGHADFEFTVERNGSVSSLRLLKSSGTAALDRAARNALTSSRLPALPDDYGPPRVVMQISFSYNEGPQGS